MKEHTEKGRVMRCSIIAMLISFITLSGINLETQAQGWSFTPSIVQSDCGSSSYVSTANAMLSQFSTSVRLPTETQCKALRQQLDGWATGGDWYTSGNPPVLHHCTIRITCTPCSGSDIVTPGQGNPGDVSFDGQTQGKPLFTPHQSEAFEDWARDYKALLESYGITSILGNKLTPHPTPQTGDKDFDKFYNGQQDNFNPPAPADSIPKNTDDFLNKKPILFRSDSENKAEQERDWLRNHPGLGPFAPVTGDGIPYLEEGDFWTNFVTDKDLLKMEQHALFVGVGVVAGLTGEGEVAGAIKYGLPIAEESVKAIEDCIGGNCPSTETFVQNVVIGEMPNLVGASGEAISARIGAAALSGVDAINTSEVGRSTFKFVFGTLDKARSTWESLTK